MSIIYASIYVHSHLCSYTAVVSHHLHCETGAHHPQSAPISTGISIVVTGFPEPYDLCEIRSLEGCACIQLSPIISLLVICAILLLWISYYNHYLISWRGHSNSWKMWLAVFRYLWSAVPCSKNMCLTSYSALACCEALNGSREQMSLLRSLTTPLLYPALIDRDLHRITKVMRTCQHIQHLLVWVQEEWYILASRWFYV